MLRTAVYAGLLLATSMATPRAAAAEAGNIGLAITAFGLDNGLRVLLHEDHSSPTVVVYLWYRVGSKDERPERTGFAHLFEHLMFKGSKHVADGEFDQLLEAAGGWSNGSTSADRTNYFEQLPSNFLELALYLEADRMAGLWAAMNAKVLDNQREVVKNERRQSYEDAPYGQSYLTVQQALWPPGHGNHNLTIGTMEHLNAATLAEFETFYRSYYVPNNATLIIAGDIDVARTRALVTRYFGWIPRQADPHHARLDGPITPRTSELRLRSTDRVQVARVSASFRAPAPFTDEDMALRIAAHILAGGKTSRLHKRLVIDERLASYVNAEQLGEFLGGTFEVSALAKEAVAPEPTFAIIDEELARLALAPPSPDELARAQKILEATLLQGLEGLVARADRLAEYDAYAGDPAYLETELAQLRKTSAAQVSAAVKKWLQRDARVVMFVTPKPDAEQK